MPTPPRKFDFLLNNKGYMLAQSSGARRWRRSSVPDAPSRRSTTDAKYGALPDVIDHPEVWDDWSAGFGAAYRDPERPNMVHWSENFDLRFQGQAVHAQQLQRTGLFSSVLGIKAEHFIDTPIPGVANPPPGAGAVFVTGHGYVGWFVPTGLTPTGFDVIDKTDPGRTYVGRPATFGSYNFVGLAEATGFIRWPLDSIAQAQSTERSRGFEVAGNRLWRIFGPDSLHNIYVSSADNPSGAQAAAGWSATLPIGNQQANARDLIAVNDQIMVGVTNGLYVGDQSGTFVNVLPHLRSQVHEDNARDLAVHDAEVIVPTVGGLFAYQPSIFGGLVGEVRDISPPTNSSRSPIKGHVRAVRSHGPWLYGGLWTGSQSYLLAGREDRQRGGFRWHVLNRLPNTARVHRLHVDAITAVSGNTRQVPNRFWVATDASFGSQANATAPLYYQPIPLGHGNPLNPDTAFSASYVGSARMDLGRVDGGAPITPKIHRSVEVRTEASSLTGTQAGQWCEVYYSLDGGPFVYLDTAATSPVSTLYFPRTEGSFVSSNTIEYSLRSFTASASHTPVYRGVVGRWTLNAPSSELIDAQISLADNLADREGTPMRSGAVMVNELRDLANPNGAGRTPIRLVDPLGNESLVRLLERPEETEVWHTGQQRPEMIAQVRLAVLNFSGA